MEIKMTGTKTIVFITIAFASGFLFRGWVPAMIVQAQSDSMIHVGLVSVAMGKTDTRINPGSKVVGFSCEAGNCYVATQ
jgi:hypothetical protein